MLAALQVSLLQVAACAVVGAHGGQVRAEEGSTGKYHFNLVAPNGPVLATGESYHSKASPLNGIESVTRNAPNAEVDDQTSN